MTTQVMIVDDDEALCRLVRQELGEQDYEVVAVHSGEEAMAKFADIQPDLVLLDLMLPGVNGLEVLRRLRATSTIPVIVFSARSSDADKVRGLEMGADDYVAKPYNPLELSARVRSVLRRDHRHRQKNQVIATGGLEINLARSLVSLDGQPVRLTGTEWNLLRYFAEHPGRVLPSQEILRKVWGLTYHDDMQYLRVWVSRLRHKIEPGVDASESMIRTFNGIGYMFVMSPDLAPQPAEHVSIGTVTSSD